MHPFLFEFQVNAIPLHIALGDVVFTDGANQIFIIFSYCFFIFQLRNHPQANK